MESSLYHLIRTRRAPSVLAVLTTRYTGAAGAEEDEGRKPSSPRAGTRGLRRRASLALEAAVPAPCQADRPCQPAGPSASQTPSSSALAGPPGAGGGRGISDGKSWRRPPRCRAAARRAQPRRDRPELRAYRQRQPCKPPHASRLGPAETQLGPRRSEEAETPSQAGQRSPPRWNVLCGSFSLPESCFPQRPNTFGGFRGLPRGFPGAGSCSLPTLRGRGRRVEIKVTPP